MEFKNKRILFVVNVDWFFVSHRLKIAEEAIKFGYDVYVASEDTGFSNELFMKGIKFIKLSISRSGTNPLSELKTFICLSRIFYRVKPDLVHLITLKPIIYGSILSKLFNVNYVVNSLSGLGYNFTGERVSFIQKLIIKFMRYGFNRSNVFLIFQNKEDSQELKELGIISFKNNLIWIKGSGVDLFKFKSSDMPSFDKIIFLFPARMLWDKGVKELLEASKILKIKYKNKIQFILAGMSDEENKSGISSKLLIQWKDGEYFKWIGFQSDMFKIYNNSHVVILPSYREGLPKTLIEACSMGRAIITTDAIGCRDCVDEGINGFKIPVKDSKKLADVIEQLIKSPNRISEMGKASRIKAEREFNINNVIATHMEIYNQLLCSY